MSKTLKSCFEKLKFIAEVKDAQLRKKLLGEISDNCLAKALQEICANIENDKIQLNKSQKRKIRKFKSVIKKLSKPILNKKLKLNLIKQTGGFLPIILPALGTALATYLAS